MDQLDPLILVADPDPEIAAVLSSRLAEAVGDGFEVAVVGSEDDAARMLNEAKATGRPVALLVSCVEFGNLIEQAPAIDPMVRIVASFSEHTRDDALEMVDTDRAHDASLAGNDFELDLKDTAQKLLEDWRNLCDPTRNAAIIVGRSFSARTHVTREFLELCGVRHVLLEPDSRDARPFAGALGKTAGPLVISPGRWSMLRPEIRKLALAFNLTSAPRRPTYDVAIVGAGPAGMDLAMNLGTEGLSVMVLEADVAGGQAARSSKIWNVLGFPDGISGRELMALALRHGRKAHAEFIAPYRVQEIEDEGDFKRIVFDTGEIYARSVVIATGVKWRKLDAPNVKNLVGAGVYYESTVHGLPDITGQEVVVVGGGNSAGQAALKIAETAAQVRLLVRGGSLDKSMSRYLINDIDAADNIAVITNTEVAAAVGSTRLSSVVVKNNLTGEQTQIPTKHLLLFIGSEPKTRWLEGLVERSERGHILTGYRLEAAHPGASQWAGAEKHYATSTKLVWAIGDVRAGIRPRVSNAIGDASVAAHAIHEAITGIKRDQVEVGGPPEVVSVKVATQAQTGPDADAEAEASVRETLCGDGYRLEPSDKPNVWSLCQERDGVGKAFDHIAMVSLTKRRIGGKEHFNMRIEVPQEHLIGTPEQRRRQVEAWKANLQDVLAERFTMRTQQQPPSIKGGGVAVAL